MAGNYIRGVLAEEVGADGGVGFKGNPNLTVAVHRVVAWRTADVDDDVVLQGRHQDFDVRLVVGEHYFGVGLVLECAGVFVGAFLHQVGNGNGGGSGITCGGDCGGEGYAFCGRCSF